MLYLVDILFPHIHLLFIQSCDFLVT